LLHSLSFSASFSSLICLKILSFTRQDGTSIEVGAHSNSGRSPSPQPTQYAPLPPNAIQALILSLSQPAPTVSILSQQSDSKPIFQIDYSLVLTVTHVHTGQPIGSVGFNSGHKLILNQPSTNTSVTYRDHLQPPPWFTSTNGNKLFWNIPAFNGHQATLHCEIVDRNNHLMMRTILQLQSSLTVNGRRDELGSASR